MMAAAIGADIFDGKIGIQLPACMRTCRLQQFSAATRNFETPVNFKKPWAPFVETLSWVETSIYYIISSLSP